MNSGQDRRRLTTPQELHQQIIEAIRALRWRDGYVNPEACADGVLPIIADWCEGRYPTAWAYEQVCRVEREQRDRAEKAEAERDALRSLLNDIHDGLDSIAHGATNGKPWAAKMAQRIADKIGGDK